MRRSCVISSPVTYLVDSYIMNTYIDDVIFHLNNILIVRIFYQITRIGYLSS